MIDWIVQLPLIAAIDREAALINAWLEPYEWIIWMVIIGGSGIYMLVGHLLDKASAWIVEQQKDHWYEHRQMFFEEMEQRIIDHIDHATDPEVQQRLADFRYELRRPL